MSHIFTAQYFRREYLHRVAEGELLPKWSDSTAISMLILQMNKPRKQGCDFGAFSFFDIKWLDFLSGIFCLDEQIETSETGLQIKVIDEQSCYECLKSFVEQIKNPEIKISILKFFLLDEFKTEILEKNYIAYRNSSEMIQEQCAIVLGEVNRAIHGSVAPDLANLPDDYGDFEEAESEKSKNGNKQIIDFNGAPHVLELYQLPTEEGYITSVSNAQSHITPPPTKFSYIKSDDPIKIKEIEDTIAIYVRGNKPSELCKYLFQNEGILFLKLPQHADTIFSCIIDRWGDLNRITPKGLRTAWNRHHPVRA